MQILVLAYIASGVLVLQGSIQAEQAAANMIIDVVVIMFFTYIVFQALNRKPRFIQSVSALLGVGILFHLLAWPVLMQQTVVDDVQMLSMAASLAMLLLISWNLLVTAHILKQAIESGMTNAILLSFALFFISMTLSRLILSE